MPGAVAAGRPSGKRKHRDAGDTRPVHVEFDAQRGAVFCGVGAAVANAIYNATGVRVRDYPITLDKLLARLPAAA